MAESKKRGPGRPANDGPSPSRYYGKVCGNHPELNGLRVKSSHECVKCHRASIFRTNHGVPSSMVRISRAEYNGLLARIAELETRLYGATQEQES